MDLYYSESEADSVELSSGDETIIEHTEIVQEKITITQELSPIEQIVEIAKDKQKTLFKIMTVLFDNFCGCNKQEKCCIKEQIKIALNSEIIPQARLKLIDIILNNFLN